MAKKKNNFLVIGHGGSGTSLLRGFLDSHSKITCGFELWGDWDKAAAECESPIWGNKQPLERFWGQKWEHEQLVELVDKYLIVWIVRRYEKWLKKQKVRIAEANWQKGRAIYWAMRNREPSRIIEVSFEDLLLRPMDELRRVCGFLRVRYEPAMLQRGTNNTGHRSFDYGRIITDKV